MYAYFSLILHNEITARFNMQENRYKLSIRFYNDCEVRAVWNEEKGGWFFSVLDVIGAINGQNDYAKTRNYWKYLKTKLKKDGNEVVSATNQLKLLATDGKRRLTDTLDANGIIELAKAMPNQNAMAFLDMMLKSRHKCCIDWSKIGKNDYLEAMTLSVADSTRIKQLLHGALTDDINSREMFMKGIDYSYYYEQSDE